MSKKASAKRHTWRMDPVQAELAADKYLTYQFNAKKVMNDMWGDVSVQAQRSRWARLVARQDFQQALVERINQLATQFKAERRAIIGELLNHASANIFEFFEQDERGNLSLRSDIKSGIPVARQRLIRKIKVKTDRVEGGEGDDAVLRQQVELHMVDVQRAVDGLARYLGLYSPDGSDSEGDLAQLLRKRISAVETK